jgi:type IV secretory pathway TraG/TraD family ATPase VirD4
VPELYNHVSTLNGRGMFFEIGVQDYSQLDALYGQYNAKTIINNCAKVFFAPESIEMAEEK